MATKTAAVLETENKALAEKLKAMTDKHAEVAAERDKLMKDGDALYEKHTKLVEAHDLLSAENKKLAEVGGLNQKEITELKTAVNLLSDEDGEAGQLSLGVATTGKSNWKEVVDSADKCGVLQAFSIGRDDRPGTMLRFVSKAGAVSGLFMAGDVMTSASGDGVTLKTQG